jgi:hypothetical protein
MRVAYDMRAATMKMSLEIGDMAGAEARVRRLRGETDAPAAVEAAAAAPAAPAAAAAAAAAPDAAAAPPHTAAAPPSPRRRRAPSIGGYADYVMRGRTGQAGAGWAVPGMMDRGRAGLGPGGTG